MLSRLNVSRGDRLRPGALGILARSVGCRRRSGPGLEGAGETLFVPESDCLCDLLDRLLRSAQKVEGFVATGFRRHPAGRPVRRSPPRAGCQPDQSRLHRGCPKRRAPFPPLISCSFGASAMAHARLSVRLVSVHASPASPAPRECPCTKPKKAPCLSGRTIYYTVVKFNEWSVAMFCARAKKLRMANSSGGGVNCR